MHPRTLATLKELREARWFAAVGQPADESVILVASWAEAVRTCSSVEYEELQQEASNGYSQALSRAAPDRFNSWNRIVEEVRAESDPLVSDKATAIAAENGLPQVFLDTVRWDILHVLIEAEFADILPPGFFASNAYWYVAGRFPCGWKGRFPEGKLMVY